MPAYKRDVKLTPAVRLRSGEIHEGINHGYAFAKLPREQRLHLEKIIHTNEFDREITMGFTAPDGQFLSKEEARRLREGG